MDSTPPTSQSDQLKNILKSFCIHNSNRGVIGGLLDSFNGIYENIVKDYVTDVYTDVIEGYSIATIKVSIEIRKLYSNKI